ncbi:low temperature requirement protein A [Plantactinospora sp. WMMC1484]|uniref:low temperature requirement protein A n=1 Tax=Plantactinospora sp. WMMC1484 TaxID=3404122 RepID=UPI003BF54A14
MTTAELPRILRKRGEPEYPTFLELFFDLVYIFMLSRLSTGLAGDLSARSVFQTAVLFCVAWWVWVLTAWLTDIFNPRLAIIQATTLVIMFGALLMAVAVPAAFTDRAHLFVAAYFGIQLVRAGVLIPGTRVNRTIQAPTIRILFWFLIAAPLWVAGAFADEFFRLVLWAVAVAVELNAPRIRWPTPWLGRTDPTIQPFTGTHLAERHREIFLIALGELVLTVGVGLAQSDFTAREVAVCAVSFGSAVLLFLLYLGQVRRLQRRHAVVERIRPGIFTSYTHLTMVGGVLLISTGTTLVLEHPDAGSPAAWIPVLLGGPALVLLGSCFFDHVVTGRTPRTRAAAIGVLALVGPAMFLLPPVGVMLVGDLVLLVTLLVEMVAARRRP